MCNRRPAVPESGRAKLCDVCAPDGRIVAEVAAALKAAGQPPLGVPVPAGRPLHRLRSRGIQAQARLDSRRRPSEDATSTAPRQQRATPTGRAQPAPAPRRLSEQDKRAGAHRLRQRISRIERQLREVSNMRPHACAKLEEELSAARRLLARWSDSH